MNGQNPEEENKPDYLLQTISQGYDVEADVWLIENQLWLGHDEPTYQTTLEFINHPNIWCHAKNSSALSFLIQNNIRCFWHQEDDYTLTSNGFIWVYPGKKLLPNSIVVMPERVSYEINDLKDCHAICTDFVKHYEKMFI